MQNSSKGIMGMDMRLITDIFKGYNLGRMQSVNFILKTMLENDLTPKDLIDYVESELDIIKGKVEKDIKTNYDTIMAHKAKIKNNKPEPKPKAKTKEEKKQVPFMKSGETKIMEGVVCEKCKGVVYSEALCRKNPLVKYGYIRRGICGE